MTTSRMHRLLPPQLVVLITIAMILLTIADRTLPRLLGLPWTLIGVVPLFGGGVLCVGNARRFEREDANIVTFGDPTALITDGWFARTRNPMYVGFLLMLIGIATLLGSLLAWVGPVLFFGAAHGWYIPFEERRMEARFGDAYRDYADRVRPWI